MCIRDSLEIPAEGASDHFAHAQRGARWRINLHPMVSFDDLDVVALIPVSYTHLRAHETVLDLVCRLLLEKKKQKKTTQNKKKKKNKTVIVEKDQHNTLYTHLMNHSINIGATH